MQHRDESGRGFELQRKKNWKNEEEECVSVFGRENKKRGITKRKKKLRIKNEKRKKD